MGGQRSEVVSRLNSRGTLGQAGRWSGDTDDNRGTQEHLRGENKPTGERDQGVTITGEMCTFNRLLLNKDY